MTYQSLEVYVLMEEEMKKHSRKNNIKYDPFVKGLVFAALRNLHLKPIKHESYKDALLRLNVLYLQGILTAADIQTRIVDQFRIVRSKTTLPA